jgi:branched-chain amino acid transport system permease protein
MGYGKDMRWLAGFLAVLVLAPPLMGNNYYLTVLTMCCLNAMIAVGLNLLVGHAGQVSLGHAGFYGLAAYTTAVLSATLGVPVGLSMLTGVGLTSGLAALVGLPALKLRGHYLAMATLGFGIILSILFNETVGVTGGPSGFTGIPRLSLAGVEFTSDLSVYYLIIAVLGLVVWLAFNILHSRVGRALRALHTSEKAAQAVGIDIARYKLFIFVVSAAFAGLAGVLYAHYLTFIAPASFGFLFSVQLIVMVVLGGMTSIPGTITGAFFLTVLPEFLRAFDNIEVLLFGAILVLCMMYLPDGLAGGSYRLWRRLWRLIFVRPDKYWAEGDGNG